MYHAQTVQDQANRFGMQTVSRQGDRRLPAPPCPPEPVDLLDVSSPVGEICSALALSLREGDVDAAEPLFGFIVDQVADHRMAITDVLAPMLFREMNAPATSGWSLFVSSASELLSRLRRPVTTPDDGRVLLFSLSGGISALSLQMAAVLLDHAHVEVSVQLGTDPDMFARAVAGNDVAAAAVGVADIACLAPVELVIHQVRRSGTPVVVVAPMTDTCPAGEATAVVGARHPGELTDLLLRVRGPLSPGEAEVLRMAADGYTNVRIAHELDISVSAVKARLESGYSKLNAADRTHAVAIALRRHWIL